MTPHIVIFSHHAPKYITDLIHLSQMIDNPITIITRENMSHLSTDRVNIQQMHTIYELLQYSPTEAIIVGYGRDFGGWVFSDLKYVLNKWGYSYFTLPNGISIDSKLFRFPIKEKKHPLKLCRSSCKFYGYALYSYILYQKITNVSPRGGHDEDCGILELSRIQNNLPDSTITTQPIITIIEQPFILQFSSETIQRFFEWINTFCLHNSGYTIIRKIHPRSDPNRYKKYLTAKNITIKTGDIEEYLKKSRYIVGYISTVLLSAILYQKKIIVIDPIDLFIDHQEFALFDYPNTGYMATPGPVESVALSKKGKSYHNLLFDKNKFVKLIEHYTNQDNTETSK